MVFTGWVQLSGALNPETGLISGSNPPQSMHYTYDANGNLTQRLDARGTTSTTTYDAVNRVQTKTYNDGITPWVTYTYGLPSAACPSSSFSIGRLCSVSSNASTTNYFYNYPSGEVSSSSQVTGGTTYTPANPACTQANVGSGFGYSYNMLGGLACETYPSGRVVSYSYDNGGRVNGLTDGQNNPYAKGITYAPQHVLGSMTLGNNISETWTYNSRLQVAQMATSGGFLTLNYNYCNQSAPATDTCSSSQPGTGNPDNGNVLSAAITRNETQVASQVFGYDGENRLKQAVENAVPCSGTPTAGWCQQFTYDAYGNRALNNFGLPVSPLAQTLTSGFNANNQNATSGWNYDPAGNVIADPGPSTYGYDAENRQIYYCPLTTMTCTASTATWTYSYDGNGKRVQRQGLVQGAPVATTFVYDGQGELVADYGWDPALPCAEACYVTVDSLGSTRLLTDQGGNPQQCFDYLPFGENLNRSNSPCYSIPEPIRQQFTSKERDSESGLDFFGERYFSSAQGRFTSPDSMLAKQEWLADPQRWNKYAYVRNNPLRFTDPNGEDLVVYWFYGKDLTDEQKKYLQANMNQIQAAITDKFKKAGVDKVDFRDGSQLTQKQIDKILQNGGNTSTTGIGLLNFANKSFSGYTSSSDQMGATGSDTRSAVFLGNLQTGLNLQNPDDANAMNFRLGEVGAHELGHGQSFESDSATWNFIKDLGGTRFGFGNLMGEGQGVPWRSKQFDPTQDKTQRAIQEINRIGDNTPPKQ